MHENWATVRRWSIRSRWLSGLIWIMPDLGETRCETGVVADTGAGHQKMIKLLESEMSV